MVKVTELSENEIEEIGEAFADYNYADGEKGMSFLYSGRDSVKEYICGYVRAMLAGGCLFSTSDKHEAFVAYKFSKDKLPASAGFSLYAAENRVPDARFQRRGEYAFSHKKRRRIVRNHLKEAKEILYFRWNAGGPQAVSGSGIHAKSA